MEQFDFQESMIVLDAYNSNPDSLKPALESLHFLAKKRNGRAIAVLGDMLELGKLSEVSHEHAGIWAYENGVDALFLYGDFASYYKKGFKNSGGTIAQIYSNKSELAKDLFEFLEKNDVVLIKGSRGMVMETVWTQLQQMLN
jgi:UDP-N-acetylmuramoyl-tripeptide--D-alanyl-D-alanine ligase